MIKDYTIDIDNIMILSFVEFILLWTETIECTTLTFESIDNIHGCNRFTFSMFSISNRISNDIFKKDF